MGKKILDFPEGNMGIAYAWKSGANIPVKPEIVAAELRRLSQNTQTLRPEQVLEAARDEKSPLHAAFQWDDGVAAEKYREQQAQYILRSLVVVYRKPDGELTAPTRAFVNIVQREDDPANDDAVSDAVAPRVYLPVRRVTDDPELRRRWVRQAYLEAAAWRKRYRDIQEFAAIFEAIDQAAGLVGPETKTATG